MPEVKSGFIPIPPDGTQEQAVEIAFAIEPQCVTYRRGDVVLFGTTRGIANHLRTVSDERTNLLAQREWQGVWLPTILKKSRGRNPLEEEWSVTSRWGKSIKIQRWESYVTWGNFHGDAMAILRSRRSGFLTTHYNSNLISDDHLLAWLAKALPL